MSIGKSSILLGAAALVAAGLVIFALSPVTDEPAMVPQEEQSAPRPPAPAPKPKRRPVAEPTPPSVERSEAAEEPPDPTEAQEAENERKVEEFDGLTDKWMDEESDGREVALKDIDEFVTKFKALPSDRQEECLQRAINLIPDRNVMLLVGVLMDKSQPREYVELVFNDILNRDEAVKQPIMQRVHKDKSHPCWADAAWILDVTGEKQ